jgi:hypothetical protein
LHLLSAPHRLAIAYALVLLFLPFPDSTWLLSVPVLAFAIAWLLNERVRSATRAVIRYLLGTDCDLPQPDEYSESGTSQGLSILAFILTQSIALLASQIGKVAIKDQTPGYKAAITTAYAVLTVVVLGSVVGLIRSTGIAEPDADLEAGAHETPPRPKRSFDRGTLTFLRWVMLWGLLTSIALFGAAWLGWLPTQETPKKIPLEWSATASTVPAIEQPELKDYQPVGEIGKPVIRLDAQISPADLHEITVPKSLSIAVSVDPEVIQKGWRIFSADLFEGDPDKNIKHFPFADPDRNISNPPAKAKFNVKLDELKASDSYSLCLWLYKEKATKEDVATYATELNRNKDRSKIISVFALWSSP